MSKRQKIDNLVEEITFKSTVHSQLYNLILEIEKHTLEYYNFEEIKKGFYKLLEDNCEGKMNLCVECGIDMGRYNDRQLCGKYYCFTIFDD